MSSTLQTPRDPRPASAPFAGTAAREHATADRIPWFWPIVALGLVLRLLALALLWRIPITSDAADYCDTARRLLSGAHFIPYWPPGLPLFLAPFAALGLSDTALRIPMLLWWALAVWGFVLLTRALSRSTGTPLARFAVWPFLLFTLLPVSIHLSVETLTQLPVAALLLVALSAAIRCGSGAGRTSTLGQGALLGLSLGATALIRPSAVPLLVLLPAVGVWRSRRWQPALLAIVLGFSMVGGWVLRAHTLSDGSWLFNTANSQNLWYGNNPATPLYRTWFFGSHAKPGFPDIDRYPAYKSTLLRVLAMPPLQRPRVFQTLAMHEIASHPGTFLLRTSNRVRCFFGFDTFTSLNLRKEHPHLFLPSLALEAGLYLALLGPAVFWLAARNRDFWLGTRARENWFGPNTLPTSSWPLWTVLLTTAIYAAPYWLSMSHPTYHYPVLLPLALLGTLAFAGAHPAATEARLASADAPAIPLARWRGWLAVAVLLAIQLEWILQAGSAAS